MLQRNKKIGENARQEFECKYEIKQHLKLMEHIFNDI